ncbi:MAG: ATP-binding protein, partial [Candidatus Binatia bacterium]
RISRQLHPSILDDLGLVDAIASECVRFKETEGISVRFKSENIPEGLSKEISLCLYRVTQESLRNMAKHSQAKRAHVKLTGAKGDLILSVRDSGIGFSRNGVRGKAGLGLASMEERVRLIQGHLSIRSNPGKGTIIKVQVPIAEEINETTTRAIG